MRFWTNCFLCFCIFFKKDVNANYWFLKSKKRFKHIEFPEKLLNHFSRSNKSNINQLEDAVTVMMRKSAWSTQGTRRILCITASSSISGMHWMHSQCTAYTRVCGHAFTNAQHCMHNTRWQRKATQAPPRVRQVVQDDGVHAVSADKWCLKSPRHSFASSDLAFCTPNTIPRSSCWPWPQA